MRLMSGECFTSGRGDRGARISLALGERFRWDFCSGRGDRGARIFLAPGKWFR
ncbi:hypothetical protein J6590_014495 [Homalodisca vitripennis]|nr:hypothetical protein J6590_014495 [Homalodisca vitripennis]